MTRPLRGRGPLQDPEMKTMLISGRATRLVRLVAAVGLALGGLALATPAASASMAPAKAGWLRLAHLSPNTPAVDVYLYSFGNPDAKIVLHHVAYGTVSPYEHVPAGEYTVAMRGAGAPPSSKPVLSTPVNIMNASAYPGGVARNLDHPCPRCYPERGRHRHPGR